LLEVLSKTAVIAPAHVGKLARVAINDYAPQFPLRLMNKDFQLILKAAAEARLKRRFASILRSWHTTMKTTSPLSCGGWKKLPVSQIFTPPRLRVDLEGKMPMLFKENKNCRSEWLGSIMQ
jgi:hypothetical protein